MARPSNKSVREKEVEIMKMESRLQKKKTELRRLKEKDAVELGQIIRRVFSDDLPYGKEEQEMFLQNLKLLYDRYGKAQGLVLESVPDEGEEVE